MSDYKQSYLYLFNKLSDLSEEIKSIQIEAEELYISNVNECSDNSPIPDIQENE